MVSKMTKCIWYSNLSLQLSTSVQIRVAARDMFNH